MIELKNIKLVVERNLKLNPNLIPNETSLILSKEYIREKECIKIIILQSVNIYQDYNVDITYMYCNIY